MTVLAYSNDTIAAQATAPGKGGVGIIRVSGPKAVLVANKILGKCPKTRYADYLSFNSLDGELLDQGIALFFKGPNSFTGEDVLELQGHGGPVIVDMLLQQITQIEGIRLARAGEFSERAFLNDKIDLAQAEAIADLIESTSVQAAKSAMQSLQGEFSNKIHQLVEQMIRLRIYVEAAIDFPDEEIDFLSDGKVENDLLAIIDYLVTVQNQAKQGAIMREGMKVVIAGKPNAGKSSLLNALSGKDSAIVTEIAGTTRDVLKEHIHIDGMPLHIFDTAGLRESPDKVEQIGIKRAWQEINSADKVLLLVDASENDSLDPKLIWPEFMAKLPKDMSVTIIRNKIDLVELDKQKIYIDGEVPVLSISAQHDIGIQELKTHLKKAMGFQGTTEGTFMARRRHLDALEAAYNHLLTGKDQLQSYTAGEILAEELRIAQQHLNEITGEFSSDDLLGRIFSSFCIGK
ncbi:tRNA uridine-5-carboxymethylaminomethyl(34) synthesis GTPase MnmE [Psychrosphaera aquimarina]|uniref:tRNA modification GTPase MnmE n=1 Tax=Psychrosphaera aquimarina TaxID=2044854 RepID=A0ABU3QXQ0_9GAMM|nr:tRNA uridine-5-carboxymethylaminomethyl(34) synthesis GTPase MnmE [Psychrosphaera aquimarina]MDU0112224.1 tRNA uridine-5-carboxymethylaminomethyl(34) synthesis GTPase MnmE [Psychrosphaera aquimarina]